MKVLAFNALSLLRAQSGVGDAREIAAEWLRDTFGADGTGSMTHDDLTRMMQQYGDQRFAEGVEAAAKLIEPKNHESDWTDYARNNANAAKRIRALITAPLEKKE